jgi:hypothetical protein
MAKKPNLPETPAEPRKEIEIEYMGEGAKDVKFNRDPKATRIQVFADGRVLQDY